MFKVQLFGIWHAHDIYKRKYKNFGFFARHVLNSMDGKANKACSYSSSKVLIINDDFRFHLCLCVTSVGALYSFIITFFNRMQWRWYNISTKK